MLNRFGARYDSSLEKIIESGPIGYILQRAEQIPQCAVYRWLRSTQPTRVLVSRGPVNSEGGMYTVKVVPLPRRLCTDT